MSIKSWLLSVGLIGVYYLLKHGEFQGFRGVNAANNAEA